ncbi:hypothetical protein AVEN_65158-1 [Araneus ventricosus]|uniref:Uncharacterized protein n=1 Tax=Araneus ventricosus TaxID=182803 RepID=A0A4Y2AH56_ARAVE|nr:hypothetical protein AVEN_65158-1 [Araneus ventricosus]
MQQLHTLVTASTMMSFTELSGWWLHIANAEHLAHRFKSGYPNTRDQKLHAFIPSCYGAKINTKTFSFATTSTSYQVISKGEMLNFRDMNGYVISIYNEKWWLKLGSGNPFGVPPPVSNPFQAMRPPPPTINQLRAQMQIPPISAGIVVPPVPVMPAPGIAMGIPTATPFSSSPQTNNPFL